MRGKTTSQDSLYSYIPLEERIPADHELRPIRALADATLKRMSQWLGKRYSNTGRPSIPPEYLIKASLLQRLYGIRSEIQLIEQLKFNMLFRWFVGLGLDEPVWTPEAFSMNRERLFNEDAAMRFFDEILSEAARAELLSGDHFSVDGTVIKAWASQKSFRPRDEDNDEPPDPENFRGEQRSNQTHQSSTDSDARLFRKSKGSGAELCYMGHVLMENRNGLIVDTELTVAGTAQEREAAVSMLNRMSGRHRITLGADKGYDVNTFHEQLRGLNVTPHIAQRNDRRKSVLDARTTRHAGYAQSGRKRKMVEQAFSWIKTAAGLRQFKMRGLERNSPQYRFAIAVYNMVKMVKLIPRLEYG